MQYIFNIFCRYNFIIFYFDTYIVTQGTICIIEYDTLHQIWIHIKSSVTLGIFIYYFLIMVP
jgi:hypothetical protein